MVGTPRHKCATSGIHTSFASGVDTGAVYIYDGMLRVPNSVGAHPDAFIQAKVYSESGIDRTDSDDFITLYFSNSGLYGQILESSGRIYSNHDGEIFLEASGQDPAEQSYSIHRPFIKQITGQFVFGTPETGIFRLFASGEGPLSSGSMNLYNQADTSAIVYNNLGLYASSSLGSISGVFEGSGLTLYSSGVLGRSIIKGKQNVKSLLYKSNQRARRGSISRPAPLVSISETHTETRLVDMELSMILQ